MNPDFVSAPTTATVAEAIARVRASGLGPQQVSIIVVVDENGVLAGAVALSELVRADGADPLIGLMEAGDPAVTTEADLPEIAMLMSDYNLIAMPVLDAERRPVGIIAVDDVLEEVVPEQWRRRAGFARE
jgi:Mg/Co/Ni transporter MgtE